MIKDLSIALKRPNEDFVVLATRSDDSPTQKIPTIYEIDMEKNNDRNAPKVGESSKKAKDTNKVKAFFEKNPWAKYLLIVFVAIALFVGAMYTTINVLTKRPEQLEIPNVSGVNDEKRLTKDDALKQLNELGFKNVNIKEEYNDEVEAGYVIKQSPEYRKDYNYNISQEITLTVSKGQKIVTLPKKIIGKKIDDVKAELDSLDILYNVTEEHNEEIQAGIVVSVDPEEGEEMTAATVVNIVVSKGSQYKDVEMPSVINESEASAVDTLKKLNLNVNVTYEENLSKSDGVVISQSVQNGKIIKEGETVSIVVNKQPVKSTVTINVNLKSLMNYAEPAKPDTTDTNSTTPPTTTEVEKATVVIEVGDDIILSESYPLTKTDITKTWTASGVSELKVKVNGVTEFTQRVDFNKGNQVVNVN